MQKGRDTVEQEKGEAQSIIDDTEKQRQHPNESSLERMRFDEAGNPIPEPVVKQALWPFDCYG